MGKNALVALFQPDTPLESLLVVQAGLRKITNDKCAHSTALPKDPGTVPLRCFLLVELPEAARMLHEEQSI